MIEQKVLITASNGLHTRPAKKLVDAARMFQCESTLIREDKEGNAKNLIKLMKLGITCGTEITVRCSGSDEREACKAIVKIISEMAD
jgi:phosphocarrier protein HPr